jgi:peroxin-1
MTPEFLRQKTKSAVANENSVDAKMKRMSAVDRSETMDLSHLSQLRRNNSFIDSRRFLDTSSSESNGLRKTNGWADSINGSDLNFRKPPPVSPRSSIKRGSKDCEKNGKFNPLVSSASVNSFRRDSLKSLRDESSYEREIVPISNSLSASNIKRVQEKSNKFLEQLSNQESPKKKILNSISANNLPNILANDVSPSIATTVSATSSSSNVGVSEKKQNHKVALEDIKKAIAREAHKRHFMKVRIVSDKKKGAKFMQINEIYVSKSSQIDVNRIHKVRTKENKEYHVRMKHNDQILDDKVLEVHPVLAKVLNNISDNVYVEVMETKLVCNCIESIEIIPHSNISENNLGMQVAKDIDEKFRRYVHANTRILPMILNQNQIFKLDDYLLTFKLFPLSATACCIDSEILGESVIDVTKRGEPNEYSDIMLSMRDENDRKNGNNKNEQKKLAQPLFDIEKQANIIETIAKKIHPNSNRFRHMNFNQSNCILAGKKNAGKKTICEAIKKNLDAKNINVTVFNCAPYKGRKLDSIVRDMKVMLMECLKTAPSLYIVHNLDSLCAQSHEDQQTQESEYLQKLSNGIRVLFEDFSHDYGNYVCILVTVSSLSNLNRSIYRSFGSYVFSSTHNIQNLDSNDRRDILKALFAKSQLKIAASLDLEKFVKTTEGYKIGDLCHFADRAIFFAIKDNFKDPLLNENFLKKSLAISNQLCLEGIETKSIDDADENANSLNEKIPGMDNIIQVLEEVLVWPTKFSKIFTNSPLRNQAGILLFGMGGTGKGFIVSQITKRWNLRLISIKGPELLAKYIGQSEENVRNLFERAKAAKPCVLFFDEFDSLAVKRGHDSTGVTDRVVNQLLTELDGVKSLEGVSIICATSRPDLIDPALLRSGRIDRLVECTIPNASERLEIMKFLSKSLTIDAKVDLKEYASKMNSFTGADIKSMLTSANMLAIESELKLNTNAKSLNHVVVRKEHLDYALANTKPSLSQSDIEKYRLLYDKFKNKKSVTIDSPQRVTLA